MDKYSTILIVGHNDIIENSLFQYFTSNGFEKVFSSSRMGLNPTIQPSVYDFFQNNRPEYVFFSSTRSGGIDANIKNGGEFIYHNLESQNNVIYAANKFGTKKFLYYGSSCVYPKECAQPIKEEALLTSPLEKTSEPYAVSKIAGIKLCEAFRRQYKFNAICAIPATLYGPGADTDLASAHVMGALIGKFAHAISHNEQKVLVWGSGNPRREFLYADDFVKASLFLMDHYEGDELLNMGYGTDISIKELAEMIKEISGFRGEIIFDNSKPDGAMQKLLDTSRLKNLGFTPKVTLKEGITKTYNWYINEGAKK